VLFKSIISSLSSHLNLTVKFLFQAIARAFIFCLVFESTRRDLPPGDSSIKAEQCTPASGRLRPCIGKDPEAAPNLDGSIGT
jgi:hypothetical protein